MRTARRYLAREIYRSSFVVLVALLGLFTFFQLVDELDNVSDRFTMAALFYMQALAMPTRLYDLLPIGLLIGAILALAGLAQRNELTILRVSGVSGRCTDRKSLPASTSSNAAMRTPRRCAGSRQASGRRVQACTCRPKAAARRLSRFTGRSIISWKMVSSIGWRRATPLWPAAIATLTQSLSPF